MSQHYHNNPPYAPERHNPGGPEYGLFDAVLGLVGVLVLSALATAMGFGFGWGAYQLLTWVLSW